MLSLVTTLSNESEACQIKQHDVTIGIDMPVLASFGTSRDWTLAGGLSVGGFMASVRVAD